MLQKYKRAARMSGPRISVCNPAFVKGYWISAKAYFHVVEEVSRHHGTIRKIPRVANPDNGTTDRMSFDEIADLVLKAGGPDLESPAWSAVGYEMSALDTLVISVDGMDYHLRWRDRSLRMASPSVEQPALFSPDGKYACSLAGDNLSLLSIETGEHRLLTCDGTTASRYGADPAASLATAIHGRAALPMGLWSANSRWFISHRTDERCVPHSGLVEHAPSQGGRPVLHRFAYPIPGDPVPLVTIIAIDVQTGRIVEFGDFSFPSKAHSPFTFKFLWLGDNNNVWLVRIDRYWKSMELVELELESGSGRVILSEGVEQGYVEPNQVLGRAPNIAVLERRREVIWYSERDGWGHLYLYDLQTGELKNQITSGDWIVRDLVDVDEDSGRIFFTAAGMDRVADPSRRTFCSIDLDGSDLRTLLSHDGDVTIARAGPWPLDPYNPHQPRDARAGLSADQRFAVAELGNAAAGNSTEIINLETGTRQVLVHVPAGDDEPSVRHFDAVAADGVTPLFGIIFLPSDFDERKTYSLIDYVYPGPQITQQPQFYETANSALARSIAELGFAVMMLDTRVMPSRSRAIHQCGYGHLLEPQLADHAAVVGQMRDRFSFIAKDRAGIIGYSGGGAATAHALAAYPDTFTVGVSVCGNHDSSIYHHSWSDKYRGPGNASQWDGQSNTTVAGQLKGQLLLISGDVDENVLVSQTMRLSAALIEANKNFDLIIVPGADHFLLFTSGYAQRRAWDFLVEHLASEEPPAAFELTFSKAEVAQFRDRLNREYWR